MARLTPGERRAYMQAAGQHTEMPQAPNRAARRKVAAVQPPPSRHAGARSGSAEQLPAVCV